MQDTLEATRDDEQNRFTFPEDTETISPDNLDSVVGSEESTTTEVFTHTHSSGIEFSGTIEQARKMCPVLGRMTVENAQATLQEQDLAARIAQRGREKRLAENATATETNKPRKEAISSDKPYSQEKLPAEIHDESQTVENFSSKIAPEIPAIDIQVLHAQKAIGQLEALEDPEATIMTTKPVRKTPATVKPFDAPIPQTAQHSKIAVDIRLVEPSIHRKPPPIIATNKAISLLPPVQTNQIHETADHRQSVDSNKDHFDFVKVSNPTNEYEDFSEQKFPGEAVEPPVDDLAYANAELAVDDQNLWENAMIFDIDKSKPVDLEFDEFLLLPSKPELPHPVEGIEAVITKLAEVLEYPEPEESKRVNQILLKIVSLPSHLELVSHDTENTIEHKLETLFVELLEEMEIAYTPQLIRSLTLLTLIEYQKVPPTKHEANKLKEPPRHTGTQEFLKKLQYGLGNMKRAVLKFYELGKSVLRIYLATNYFLAQNSSRNETV